MAETTSLVGYPGPGLPPADEVLAAAAGGADSAPVPATSRTPHTTRLSEEEDKEASPCLGRKRTGTLKMWGVERRVALDVLMALWGMGTWLGVNGLYVQLPLLVERLPEGWALPSSMVLAIQVANLGMVAYAGAKRLAPRVPDSFYIVLLLGIGTVALALNAFLYERTAVVGETERSVAFISLTLFAALVGCTSSVLFYPHLRHYRDVYLATYLVGEGLSGLVPSLLALAQGVGGEPECVPSLDADNMTTVTLVPVYPPPRFDTTVFLLLLAALSASSLLSFVVLTRHRAFRSERVDPAARAKDDEATTEDRSLLHPRWLLVLALMTLLNALMNGVLPSVQSYSCMPYGTQAYHLAVTLGAVANPAACLAGVWLRPLRARALAAWLVAALAPLAYILATAALSPRPPLAGGAGGAGAALVVAAWVATSATLSYARMWVYGWCRRGGARGMRACGALGQLGSALGSTLLFVLVNYAQVFTQADPCPVSTR